MAGFGKSAALGKGNGVRTLGESGGCRGVAFAKILRSGNCRK
jgi:hypothetical protein